MNYVNYNSWSLAGQEKCNPCHICQFNPCQCNNLCHKCNKCPCECYSNCLKYCCSPCEDVVIIKKCVEKTKECGGCKCNPCECESKECENYKCGCTVCVKKCNFIIGWYIRDECCVAKAEKMVKSTIYKLDKLWRCGRICRREYVMRYGVYITALENINYILKRISCHDRCCDVILKALFNLSTYILESECIEIAFVHKIIKCFHHNLRNCLEKCRPSRKPCQQRKGWCDDR